MGFGGSSHNPGISGFTEVDTSGQDANRYYDAGRY
jgi:hypothetical protein